MYKSCIWYWAILNNLQFCYANLDDAQRELIVSLSKALIIKQCVIVGDTTSDHIYTIKEFSKSNILTTVIMQNQFNFSMFYSNMFQLRSLAIVDEEQISNILLMRNAQYVMHRFVWIMFQTEWPEKELEPNIYIPYNCQFFVINSANGVDYVITEIYKINVFGEPLFRSHFGVWSEEGGLVRSTIEFYQRRWDMNGTVFGVVAIDKAGYCFRPNICAYKEMVQDMARITNFRPFFMALKESERMKTMLKTEITIGMFVFDSVDYRRDMVAPIWKSPAFLHIAHDTTYNQGDVAWYLRSFTLELWFSILIWIVTSSVSVLVIDYYSHKYCENEQRKRYLFTNTCFQALESFSNQCGTEISSHLSARIASCMNRWLTAVLIPAYSAAILSFIMVRFLVYPFADLEGLVRDGTFKIGFENDTIIDLFFQKSRDPTTQLVAQKFLLDNDKLPVDSKQVLHKLCSDKKFAFIYFNNHLMKNKYQCKLLKIPYPIFISWDAFHLRPRSPFRIILNRILKIFFSAGILQYKKDNVHGKPFQEEEEEPEDSVEFQPLIPIFQALALAQATSIFIMFMECYYKRIFDKRKSQTSARKGMEHKKQKR